MIFLKASELFSKTTRPFFLSLFFHFQNAGLTAKNIGIFDSKHRCFAAKAPMFYRQNTRVPPPLFMGIPTLYYSVQKRFYETENRTREKGFALSEKKHTFVHE